MFVDMSPPSMTLEKTTNIKQIILSFANFPGLLGLSFRTERPSAANNTTEWLHVRATIPRCQ